MKEPLIINGQIAHDEIKAMIYIKRLEDLTKIGTYLNKPIIKDKGRFSSKTRYIVIDQNVKYIYGEHDEKLP